MISRFVDNIMAVLKLLGVIIVIILIGKVLYDFAGAKDVVETHLKKLKKLKWRKADDDPAKETVKDPLTDEEIDKEIDKINNENNN